MKVLRSILVGAVLGAALASVCRADVKLPALFSNSMVLQRERAVPVWGWADPGERVTVQVPGQSQSAVAGNDRKWKVTLAPLQAGGPIRMTVSGKNSVVLDDVLIGEVWLASGQSNMDWTVANSSNADHALASPNLGSIRLFKAPKTLADTPQDDIQASWVHADAQSVPEISAVGFYFIRRIQQETGVPVGLIQSSWGGSPAEAFTSRAVLEADPELQPILDRARELETQAPAAQTQFDGRMAEWRREAADAKARGAKAPPKPRAPLALAKNKYPFGIYNGMIAPLAPYGIRGVIWYQGEANAERAVQYRRLLTAMIGNWRSDWGQPNLPFGIVQLANYKAPQTEPVERSSWAELREAQLLVSQAVPDVGLALAIDVGDADNIHPKDKLTVGERLAAWALAKVYQQPREYAGPIYRSMQRDGNRIRLRFDHAVGLRAGKDAAGSADLLGFAVAGEDQRFEKASAHIEGDSVVVWSDGISEPVAVRYGWAVNPVCNLYNGAGFPASPFRTDNWRGITDDRR